MSTVFVDLVFVPEPLTRKLIPARKRHQGWRWVARNADNQKVLARSSERYTNREDAFAAVRQLFVTGTVFKREAELGNVLLRQGQDG